MLELPDWDHWGRLKTVSLRDALVLSVNLCPHRYNHENSNEMEFGYARKYWQNLQIAKNHVDDAEWLVGRVAREDFDINLRQTNVDLVKFCCWALNFVQLPELPPEMQILGGLDFSPTSQLENEAILDDLEINATSLVSQEKISAQTTAIDSKDVRQFDEQGAISLGTTEMKTAIRYPQQSPAESDAIASAGSKGYVRKHRDILDPVIELAKKMAGNSSAWQEVWPHLSRLAQDEHPPLLGHFEEGIKYSDGVKKKYLTKDAFRKRMKRSQK